MSQEKMKAEEEKNKKKGQKRKREVFNDAKKWKEETERREG